MSVKGIYFEAVAKRFFMNEDPKFTFLYKGEKYEAWAHCLPSDNGFRKYKLNFPNILSIVEGSVDMVEGEHGQWLIAKIFSADPIHEEFLHDIAQGFVEYIDSQPSQQTF